MAFKLNIFIDCHVFDGSYQGTTTYIKGLYLEMVKNTEMNFYFAAQDVSHIKSYFGTADNVHYIRYKSHNKFYRLLIDIPRILKKYKIDYAHFQYVVPPVKNCKYINTIHDVLFLDHPHLFPLLYRLKNKFLFRLSAKKSDILLSVSNYSAKSISRHFKIDDIAVTPNAVDELYFADYDKDKVQEEVQNKFGFAKYWIYVSRWEPRKNHHRLLNIFIQHKYYQDNYLVFAGDKSLPNPEFDKIYKSVPPEIKSKIIILNKVSFSELLLLVRGASLGVYPSVAEGFGIPPLETAAALVPTACSCTTAMSDYSFFNSALFDPLSEEDMNRAVNEALKNQNLDDIRDIISERYNWESSAQILINKITEAENSSLR